MEAKKKALSEENRQKLADQFDELLMSTEREGMDGLLKWLHEETDFYTAPASSNGHGSFAGGLLVHSISVYRLLKNFNKLIQMEREDSLIIAALLHDLCKTNFYIKTIKNVKTPGKREWREEEAYAVEDAFPMGHGEKSVFLIMKHIKLTDDEAMAIRWHMGGYDDAVRGYSGGKAQSKAYKEYPLAPALSIADMFATYFAD